MIDTHLKPFLLEKIIVKLNGNIHRTGTLINYVNDDLKITLWLKNNNKIKKYEILCPFKYECTNNILTCSYKVDDFLEVPSEIKNKLINKKPSKIYNSILTIQVQQT